MPGTDWSTLVLAALNVVAAAAAAYSANRSAEATVKASIAADKSVAAMHETNRIAADALQATKDAAVATQKSVELFAAEAKRQAIRDAAAVESAAAHLAVVVSEVLPAMGSVWSLRKSSDPTSAPHFAGVRLNEYSKVLNAAAKGGQAERVGDAAVWRLAMASSNAGGVAVIARSTDVAAFTALVESAFPPIVREAHALFNFLLAKMRAPASSWSDTLNHLGIDPNEIPEEPSRT